MKSYSVTPLNLIDCWLIEDNLKKLSSYFEVKSYTKMGKNTQKNIKAMSIVFGYKSTT